MAERQEGVPSIRRSIVSPHQEVWVLASSEQTVLAALVTRIHPKSLRLYSIAVANECRGKGYGQLLLDHGLARARALGKATASLEADASNSALVRWYGNNGFTIAKHLPNYYGKRQDGVRMHLRL